MFVCKFPFGPLGTNAILIGCLETKKGAVIDPSMGSAGTLFQQASRLNVQITAILLTHSHWDHFVDAHQIKEQTKAPLYIHPLDQENLQHPGADGLPLFFPIHAVTPDFFLADGQLLEVGNLEIRVLHTPGHSPGSVCFYLVRENLLISGDTLFRGSTGSLKLATARPELMEGSLKRLSELPLNTRVIPGHGEETTIQAEFYR